jgi:hypothetical protein
MLNRATDRMTWVLFFLLTLVVSLLSTAPAVAVDPVPVTYQDQSYAGVTTTRPTEDKPQSKLFHAHGAWWAIMLDADGKLRIHELLSNHTWRQAGAVVDNRVSSTADLLFDGTQLYVASRDGTTPLRVSRMSFDATDRSWNLDAGFPVTVNAGGSESASIEKDSTGMLWVTWTRSKTVWVSHTTTSDTSWVNGYRPTVADTAVTSDDISGLISFQGKIGVMWSDQGDNKFAFAIHQDGAPDNQWTNETALGGPKLADDHINLKSLSDDPQGRVYAVVKTSLNDVAASSPSDPLILLLIRDSDGTWTQETVATIADDWTRPLLQIDTVNARVLAFGTAPEKGGIIYLKAAPLANPDFQTGRGTPFVSFSGRTLNNATGTKQPLTQQTGVVVMASSSGTDSRYYHAEMPLNPPGIDSPPTAPGAPVVTSTTASQVDLTWAVATDDVGVASYTILRDGVAVGTSATASYSDTTVQPSTTYTYSLVATDTAGQDSPQSAGTQVTTLASGGGSASGVSFVDARSGSATTASVTVTTPSTAAGQVNLLALAARGRPNLTVPAGWTLVRMDENGSVMRQWIYVRVATQAIPEATLTLTLSSAQSSSWTVTAYDGLSLSSPVTASAASVNVSSTQPAVAGISGAPTGIAVAFVGVAAASSVTPSTGWSERGESVALGTYKITGELADTPIPASGTVAPTTVTASPGGASVAQTLALTPAP